MVTVLVAVAIVPSAPLLVPELAGAAADELAGLRDAVLTAATALPQRWIAVGTAAADGGWGPELAGTFAGYGVDVRIALSPSAGEVVELPLCALIAGWIRGHAAPEAQVQVRSQAADLPAEQARARGLALRAECDQTAQPTGVLVVADGCHTLTPAAPGGHDPASTAVQNALDEALATGDTAALAALPDLVVGRSAFGVLAGLTEPAPRATKELYRGAPYGVGYFAGVWQP